MRDLSTAIAETASKENFYDSESTRFQRLSASIGRFLMPLGTHASRHSGAEIPSRSRCRGNHEAIFDCHAAVAASLAARASRHAGNAASPLYQRTISVKSP